MSKECLDDMKRCQIRLYSASYWLNLDLVLWVPKQHVYQVSLKSETVGSKCSVILGDLTRNDPNSTINKRHHLSRNKQGNHLVNITMCLRSFACMPSKVSKFVNEIERLLGCSSVNCSWRDKCESGSLCCRNHIYVWSQVWWNCCLFVNSLDQLPVVILFHRTPSTLCRQQQCTPRT